MKKLMAMLVASSGILLAMPVWAEPGTADQLSKAILKSDSKAVRALVEAGTPVKALDSKGFSPLVSTVMVGTLPANTAEALEIARVLLDAGADIEQQGPVGNTPLSAASGQHRSPAFVELLLARGAPVNQRGYNDTFPLYHAVRQRRPEIAEVLVRHGADVKAANADGQTALHHAALNNMEATATLLLAHGADINARDREGKTPLAWAFGKTPSDFIGSTPAVPAMVTLLQKRGGTE
jgi:ankyrin repeat protein